MDSKQKNVAEQIKASLMVLQALEDPTVTNEAKKIEKAVADLNKTTAPLLESYAKGLRSFDESLVSKYGLKAARVIEFGMLAALAVKAFVLG